MVYLTEGQYKTGNYKVLDDLFPEPAFHGQHHQRPGRHSVFLKHATLSYADSYRNVDKAGFVDCHQIHEERSNSQTSLGRHPDGCKRDGT